MEVDLYSVLLFVGYGIAFFCVAILAMVFLFGLSSATLLKKPRELVLLFAVAVALPFTVAGLSSRTRVNTSASSAITVTGYTVSNVSPSQVLVQFATSRPAIGYLEYKDTQKNKIVPIYPAYPMLETQEHSIYISHIRPANVWIVVNGKPALQIHL